MRTQSREKQAQTATACSLDLGPLSGQSGQGQKQKGRHLMLFTVTVRASRASRDEIEPIMLLALELDARRSLVSDVLQQGYRHNARSRASVDGHNDQSEVRRRASGVEERTGRHGRGREVDLSLFAKMPFSQREMMHGRRYVVAW
ncbi:hypothetical protein CORC01_05555 [Colletotrichum orchidophilum]|uniref:Uncharacterized protein n=1 Tax=Colletotrichum orchidophilum TaxID=1209926 RepID=A0A1G4BCE3_9PEZI|nr:uncharacterized protein CORC01_05555 [Colletotrichum orchidophilum]OHE99063.1 hypothetical protein CORC01_05555 [Colletotrichum orchidophilum]